MSNLSNSGEDALTYTLVQDGVEQCSATPHTQLSAVYCIDRCVNWIKTRKLKKVAVQFPMEVCRDAPSVALLLGEAVAPSDVTIIFNSSAARCCVSQKDADYRSAEGIIQFGRSCLTHVARVPVLRVLAPHWQLTVDKVVSGICELPEVQELSRQKEMSLNDENGGNVSGVNYTCHKEVIILYDTRCAYAMAEVEKGLKATLHEIQMSRLIIREDPFESQTSCELKEENSRCKNDSSGYKEENVGCKDYSEGCKEENAAVCCCSMDYRLGVCSVCLKQSNYWRPVDWCDKDSDASCCVDDSGLVDISSAEVNEHDQESSTSSVVILNGRLFYAPRSRNRSDMLFVFIGRSGPTLTSMMLKWPQCSFYVVDPMTGKVTTTNAAKIVMQRNFKIEQIKDAQKIGLLVSNYNLPGFHALFQRLSSLIKKAGKIPFVQYSAHPDLPKLVNTPNIDVFVYVACAESTIIEREIDPDLYKMLATPWELEVALNPNRPWSLNFETNSMELLDGGCSYKPLPDAQFNEQVVSVSLLTNRMQTVGVGDEVQSAHILDAKSGALLQSGGKQVQKVVDGHSKGLLWGETSWRGLDPEAKGQDVPPIGMVLQGKKGIAGGYVDEGS